MINPPADTFHTVTGNIAHLVRAIETVSAVGLSGSFARGSQDALSDIDICIYVAGELPAPQIRRQGYTQMGFSDSLYFDVDFETSRGDGFLVRGVRCDFNWMSISTVRAFLQERLQMDFDCPEYLPGGLSGVKAVYDPEQVIRALQDAIPQYPAARARHRIQNAITTAHFSLYDLGWLTKAAFRKDAFLFLKYQYNLLDTLFRALFALNHAWLCDEKGLASRAAGFAFVPDQIETRIQSMIMHDAENRDLSACLANLKGLFADTTRLARLKYPDLELPAEWH